jgi:hypothetical protein
MHLLKILYGFVIVIIFYFIFYHLIKFNYPLKNFIFISLNFLIIFYFIEIIVSKFFNDSVGFKFTNLISYFTLIIIYFTLVIFLRSYNTTIKDILSPVISMDICYESNNYPHDDSIKAKIIDRLIKEEIDYINKKQLKIDHSAKFTITENCNDSSNIIYPIQIISTDLLTLKNGDSIIIHQIKTNNIHLNQLVYVCLKKDIIIDEINMSEFPDAAFFSPNNLALFLRARTFSYNKNYEYAIICYRKIIDDIGSFKKSKLALNNDVTLSYILYNKVKTIITYLDSNYYLTQKERNDYKNETLEDINQILKIAQSQKEYCRYLLFSIDIYDKLIDFDYVKLTLIKKNKLTPYYTEIKNYYKLIELIARYDTLTRTDSLCNSDLFYMDPNKYGSIKSRSSNIYK